MENGVEMAPLGLYVVRGDNVALVGDVDEELDQKLDLSAVRAKGRGPIQW